MLSLFLNLYVLLFYQRYIANMIGAACNSRIPQANAEVKSFSVCFFYIHMSNVSLMAKISFGAVANGNRSPF